MLVFSSTDFTRWSRRATRGCRSEDRADHKPQTEKSCGLRSARSSLLQTPAVRPASRPAGRAVDIPASRTTLLRPQRTTALRTWLVPFVSLVCLCVPGGERRGASRCGNVAIVVPSYRRLVVRGRRPHAEGSVCVAVAESRKAHAEPARWPTLRGRAVDIPVSRTTLLPPQRTTALRTWLVPVVSLVCLCVPGGERRGASRCGNVAIVVPSS
jgi:hypothetical protein